MGRRRYLLLGLGGVIVIVIAITAASLSANLTYYLYPTEAIGQRAEFPDGRRFRLAGIVVAGSIDRSGEHIAFTVTDGGARVDVVLTRVPPVLFDENIPVLVEGAWQGQVFVGDEALIRHDENYEIPEEGGGFRDT